MGVAHTKGVLILHFCDCMFQEACVNFVKLNMDMIIHSDDWKFIDEAFLTALLQSSEIVVYSEMMLLAALKWWLEHESRVDNIHVNLTKLIPLIRFPMIIPVDLVQIENTEFYIQHQELLTPYVLMSYRYHSLSWQEKQLFNNKDIECDTHFLFRNYIDARYGISLAMECSRIEQSVKKRMCLPKRTACGDKRAPETHMDVTFFPFGFHYKRPRTQAEPATERNVSIEWQIKTFQLLGGDCIVTKTDKTTFFTSLPTHCLGMSIN